MSVVNFQHLSRVLQQYMSDSGISAASVGVEFNRLLYKTMMDIDSDNSTLATVEKNKLTVEIVARFLKNIKKTSAFDARPNVSDDPISEVELGKRMLELEAARSDVDLGDPHKDFQRALRESEVKYGDTFAAHRPDLIGLKNNVGTACDPPWSVGGLPGDNVAGLGSGADGDDGAGIVIPKNSGPKRIVRKYLLINGYDRQWASHPYRFQFSVSLSNSGSGFRDIRSISATHLVVPREIIEEKSITNATKTRFEHAFGLHYPYLILKVTDFQSVYKSTNSASQNAFAHFVYHEHYTGSNGRGYIHLKPMQNETLTFTVNTLANLEHLEIAVQRPSGALLNDSRDETKVMSFHHLNIVNIGQHMIMVTLKDYFDRNEYFVGDTVRFTGLSSQSAGLNSFINRESGHEILENGTPNPNGYTNAFYIRVPGALNKTTGIFEADVSLVALLSGGYKDLQNSHVALVINASLQVTVSFELGVEEDDIVL
jgi:hypothetical protein